MRRISVLFAAVFLSCSLASCAKSPAPVQEEKPFDTTSTTIYLESSSSSEGVSYPAEKPTADESPMLDEKPHETEPAGEEATQESSGEEAAQTGAAVPGEIRAVWMSFLEFQDLLTGRSEAEFKANITQAFDRVKSNNFTTVFVQVRPYGDALYPSKLFPWSHIVTGTEGTDPGFDPFGMMVEEAHARGLKIEAWINPYRVYVKDSYDLSAGNTAKQWADAGTQDAVWFENGLYYNPASEKARTLIVDGVREILTLYDVDGIHFDDYFYPTTSASFDKPSFEAYQSGGGEMALAKWRRENVNLLVQQVYAAIKEMKPHVLFGISPQGNNDNNYNTQFIDVAKWLSQEGYVDYICPQVYFGFANGTAPFSRTVQDWNRMIKVDSIRLYVGLSPYKLGLTDEWAGTGKEEWLDTTDLLARMVSTAREQEHYGGYSMYRYASLFEPAPQVKEQVEAELNSLKKMR